MTDEERSDLVEQVSKVLDDNAYKGFSSKYDKRSLHDLFFRGDREAVDTMSAMLAECYSGMTEKQREQSNDLQTLISRLDLIDCDDDGVEPWGSDCLPHRYRKRPVEIDAVLYDGTYDSLEKATDFCGSCLYVDDDTPFIHTLEGEHVVSKGDYIIRGVEGEFYPCKPTVFIETYERC